VPLNTAVGLTEYLRIRVIKEARDSGTYNFMACIRHMGDVVMSSSFVYDASYDFREYFINVTALPAGVYELHIYNWNDCYPPPGVLKFTYWIHRVTGGTTLVFEGWDHTKFNALMLYVFNDLLFWKHLSSTDDVVVPVGMRVYIEAADGVGNGFVGSVSGSGVVRVRPNTRIPFIAEFKIKYHDPVARDVGRALGGFVWASSPSYLNVVDDYTVEWGIIKIEPGIGWVAALIILGFVILGGIGIWAYVRVREIELEEKKLETARPLVAKYNNMLDRYLSEYAACGGDQNCIMRVQSTWFPLLQSVSSVIGLLMNRGFSLGCDGLNIGGVCLPWWVVGLVIFIIVLMVVVVVR